MKNYIKERHIESPEHEKEYKYTLSFNYDTANGEYYWSFMIQEKKLKIFENFFSISQDYPTGSELVFSEMKKEIIDEIVHNYDQEIDQFRKHITNIVFDK
jgi:hypothetical protein